MTTFDPTWLDDTLELLERSPLRRDPIRGRTFPEPSVLRSVQEISDRLEALRERVSKPMTIGVLGEVKAGKSTLVNAMVGTDVAPVDVLEATQWVMEIRAASASQAVIRFVDGSIQKGTAQEIHDLLLSQRNNREFVRRCAEVVVGLPIPALARWNLVDTPGLATVTEEAAERTRRHLAQVDVVFWVFNANHLGQMDVAEELAEVARLGKPVVAVINRCDEVDADPDRLVHYVRMHFAEYVQDVFAVSAQKARQAQRESNDVLLEESGLPQLQTYLQERFTARVEEAKAEALGQQLLALLQMEQIVHETYGRQLAFLLDEANHHHQRLELERQRIQSEAENFIDEELSRYFSKVSREFTQRLPNSTGLAGFFGNSRTSIVEHELQSALGGEAFRVWAEELGTKVDAFIREKWQEAVRGIQVGTQQRFQAFYTGEAGRLEDVEGLSGSSDLIKGLKEGLTMGGVVGTGLATYAAVLGPAAASITLGTALSALLPPALLVGAGAGIVLRYLQSDKQAERLRISLRDAIARHKQKLRSEWLETTVFPALYKHNASVADIVYRMFTEQLCQGWSTEELRALAQETTAHAQECLEVRKRLQTALKN